MSIIAKLTGNREQDRQVASQLGARYERANENMRKALESGDQSKIAPATLDLNKAQESFLACSKIAEREHDLIMQLMQSLA